jgi:putative ABC transport system substrate-binding protein
MAARRARGQQGNRVRRIGVLLSLAADDPQSLAYVSALILGLQALGWTAGRNVQIEYRWSAGDPDRIRQNAVDMIALGPDVIVASGSPIVRALQQASRNIPIVFVQVTDAVGGNLVESLARPGGNATGFTSFEYGISAKWLELLKQIAPRITRTAVLRDPAAGGGTGQSGATQAVAPSLMVEVRPIDARTASGIERGVAEFASGPNGGMIALPGTLVNVHRDLIITLAAHHRLPAVYANRSFVTRGGLISYGPDSVEQYSLAVGYVDRILKGEKPADLPVQAPTKYEMVLNLKTAKALGLDIPPTVYARADEIIE